MNEAESNFIAFRKDNTRRNSLYLLSGLLLVGSLGGLRAAPQSAGAWQSVVSSSNYVCLNCLRGPNAFVVHSYQGRSRCLDYTPEKTGSPVFINDCKLAHPVVVEELADGKHTVVLHAGTKVIGIPVAAVLTLGETSVVEQTVTSIMIQGGTSATTQGGTAPSAAGETSLELQDSGPITTFTGNHFFALDGDSIILASNHDRVAKVQNARGAIGSPVVLGQRNLVDNEFWDFVATDGSGQYPTTGFVNAATRCDLLRYLSLNEGSNPCVPAGTTSAPAGPGTVINIIGDMDFSGLSSLNVPAGVTIRGGRSASLFGSKLSIGSQTDATIFGVTGDDVRITGLRLQGPNTNRSTDDGQPNSWAIRIPQPPAAETAVYPQFARTIVDHNDISDWTSAGVEVDGPNDDMGSCKYDFRTRTPNARITHNFIHHNLEQNLGYGVVVSKDGYAMIDGQMFVSNRHAIASDGHPGSSYRAWYNLVLSYGPLQRGPFDWPFHTQDFDMHGMLSGGFGGTAGDYVDIFRNTFLGTNRPNFELRGYPCAYDQFHENISLESLDDALKWKLVDFRLGDDASVDYSNPYLRASESPNQFGHSNPTGHFGVGDFDGDGADDLFLATGAAWYYSPAGKAEWRFLSAKTDTIDRVLFGDFDGDGRTDVIAVHGSQFVISWGGISDWEVLNPFSAPGAISDMAVGDFIGDQRPDIFFADGSQWYLSDGGREPFLAMNTSSFRVPDLRFGDFDGDGKTDVFGIVSGKWQYTKSALSGWIPLRDAMVSNINALIVADFNGDRHADVGANCDDPGCWRISYWGTEDWKYFPEPFGLTGIPLAGVGHFLGHIWTDVLSWNVRNPYWMCDPNIGQDTQFCMSVAGISRTQRYSTQDMR